MNQAEVEHVLVVPTDLFHSLGYFQGFTADVDTYLDTLFDVENISYRPRPQMEQDPNFKQLIPYVIFRYIDDSGAVSLYQYSRGGGLERNVWFLRSQLALVVIYLRKTVIPKTLTRIMMGWRVS